MIAPKTSTVPLSQGKQPMSTAALQIVQAAVHEGVTLGELSTLAQGDPGFALRLLSVVNSAAFRRRDAVRDIQQATFLLGIRGMRNVALSLVVTDLVPMGEGSNVILSNSIRRAVSARLIGEAFGLKDLDSLFTMGLLLESGLLLLARDDLAAAAQMARTPAANRVIHELANGFTPHPELGSELARNYHLSNDLIEAIRHHHDAELPEERPARVGWLAERAAGVFECADIAKTRLEFVAQAAELGLDEATVDKLLAEIPKAVAATAEAFQRDLGPQLNLDKLRDGVNERLVEMNLQYQELLGTLQKLLAEKTNLATQLEAATSTLKQVAATDALTRLPNRRMLEQCLRRDMASAARNGTPLSIAVLDVDHFKNFNTVYGHKVGDEALQGVAGVLAASIRQSDLAARYGGEEFVLVFPRTDAQGAVLVCERIRSTLDKTGLKVSGKQVALTVSLGVAVQRPGENGKELFTRADAALHTAKNAGRNQVKVAP